MLLSAAFALTACGRGGNTTNDPYLQGVPDAPGLALEITGDATEGVSQSGLMDGTEELGGIIQDAMPAPANVPEYLAAARNGIKALNDQVRVTLEKVAAIAQNNPGKVVSADTRVYGPKDVGAVTWRLFVKKFSETKYGFRVDAKPTGSADTAYKIVMGGVLNRGAEAHRGRGTVGFDLDNYKLVDPTFKGTGKLLSAFAHGDLGKTLSYALKDFSPDVTAHDPLSAFFVGHKVTATGATAVRLAARVDLPNAGATPTSAKEGLVLRVRHRPGVGGRGDLVAAGGDIAQGVFYYGASCWDAQEAEGFKVLLRCTARDLQSCTVVSTSGTRDACAAGLRDDSLPPEGTDPSPEAGAPTTDLTPPATVSDGTTAG
jgi:hypothetical protein